jgi:sodium/proline symporter
VSYAWGGFGASFGPLMILSVCWKGTTSSGAIAGMISGASSIFIFKNFVTIEGEYFYELLPSFFISMLVIILVSLITSKPNEETLAQFE